MLDLRSMEYQELEEMLISMGEPKFRAKQIFSWVMQGVKDLMR